MKSITIKHLGFVLMLLPICALFMGSNCNDCWKSADRLDKSYYGDYDVSEVYTYSGGEWISQRFKEENTSTFGGSYIRVDPDDIFTSGDVVRIQGKKFTNRQYGFLIADIESYNEVLNSLEKCTCEDGSCDWEYREFGIWGFPGVGQKDMNVKINFLGWTMQLTFTDSDDTSRNFILVCNKIL